MVAAEPPAAAVGVPVQVVDPLQPLDVLGNVRRMLEAGEAPAAPDEAEDDRPAMPPKTPAAVAAEPAPPAATMAPAASPPVVVVPNKAAPPPAPTTGAASEPPVRHIPLSGETTIRSLEDIKALAEQLERAQRRQQGK